MRPTSLLWLTLVAALGCGAPPTEAESFPVTATGNGAPSGAHYDLDLVGVPQGKSADMTGGSGHVLFVPLDAPTKILLSEGPFQVLDANGTDGSASFQLPNPDPASSGTTTYSVWVRALGQPGGASSTTTCASDPTTGERYCSLYSSVTMRSAGKPTFTNVSKDLLYVYSYVNGTLTRTPLFDPSLTSDDWQYDSSGLRHAQLRFYPVATTVP